MTSGPSLGPAASSSQHPPGKELRRLRQQFGSSSHDLKRAISLLTHVFLIDVEHWRISIKIQFIIRIEALAALPMPKATDIEKM